MHTTLLDLATISAEMLIARLVVGLIMAAHGSLKLFGWFGGHGIVGTAGFFEAIGFRPSRLFAIVSSVIEIVSGVLVALGLLDPIGPALMLSVMIVAAVSVHWKNGLFAHSNGIEVALFYGTAAVTFALIGFGSYSLDAMLGLQSLYTPTLALAALAIGVVGGVGNLLARRPVVAA